MKVIVLDKESILDLRFANTVVENIFLRKLILAAVFQPRTTSCLRKFLPEEVSNREVNYKLLKKLMRIAMGNRLT